jgi:DNA gyrase/topoisomerase IV subunit A
VIVLKRDAQPRVVMNNLYKHTALQDTFGCNMLAIVDDVPRTLRLDQFISLWVKHQLEVIRRRTQWQLEEAERAAHLDRGLVKALNMLDEVIALIRASSTADEANLGLQELLGVDELQARNILDQQLRRLASMEIQKIVDRLARIELQIADLKDILADEARQRTIISTELQEIVDKYGDERRSRIVAADGDFSEEDFIPNEDVVVTITHGGYAKRTHAAGRRRGAAPLHHHEPPVDPLLHELRPGVPGEGVAAAGVWPRREGRPRRGADELPARREDRPGADHRRLRRRPVPPAGHEARLGEEDGAEGLRFAAPGRCYRHQLPRGG